MPGPMVAEAREEAVRAGNQALRARMAPACRHGRSSLTSTPPSGGARGGRTHRSGKCSQAIAFGRALSWRQRDSGSVALPLLASPHASDHRTCLLYASCPVYASDAVEVNRASEGAPTTAFGGECITKQRANHSSVPAGHSRYGGGWPCASIPRPPKTVTWCEPSCRCATAGGNSRPAPGRGSSSGPASPTTVERRRRAATCRGRSAARRALRAGDPPRLAARPGRQDRRPPQLVQRLLFGLLRPIARATGHRGVDPSMHPGDPANPRPARPRVASSAFACPPSCLLVPALVPGQSWFAW
jgi:hypothetical protein